MPAFACGAERSPKGTTARTPSPPPDPLGRPEWCISVATGTIEGYLDEGPRAQSGRCKFPLQESPLPASSILLFDSDPGSSSLVRSTLSGTGSGVVIAEDRDSLLRIAVDQHLIVLAPGPDGPSAVELCRDLRAHPLLEATPILVITESDDVEERIRLLEAGIEDAVAKPFDARELEARVEALLLRFWRSRDLAIVPATEPVQRGQRLVVVFSPKGGVGTSTIAVNLATHAAQAHPNRALLVDLDLQFGQVATHLNLVASYSIIDLVRDEESLRDLEVLAPFLAQHESGLHVLGAPSSPEHAQLVTAPQVHRLFSELVKLFDVVVVDAGSTLDERSLAVLELAQRIVVPITGDLGTLKALSTMLDYLNEIGSIMTKAIFVLNNVFAKELLKASDIEGALGTRISIELPYDQVVYLKAVNEGVPVLTGSPKSHAADRLAKLATAALGNETVAPAAARPEKRRGFALLRRA
jgi:pilus assembly protein CpaE